MPAAGRDLELRRCGTESRLKVGDRDDWIVFGGQHESRRETGTDHVDGQAHTEIDVSQIGPASRLVERLTNYPVPPNKAIVGANAFAHESGIHQDGLLKDVATYQIIDPAELGLAMTLPLGKHSGRHAVSRACEAAGLSLDEDSLVVAFARFKARADQSGAVSIHELFQEVTLT